MLIKIRYFGAISGTSAGGFTAERDDGLGNVYVSEHESAAAGGLAVGDRIEFNIRPGLMAVDVLLLHRARHLHAQAAE